MNRFSVPKVLGDMISLLPAYPGSVLFVSALNVILTPRLPEDVREMILGKQLRLTIMDARLDFNFVWTKGGFVAGWGNVEPDMIISASAYDFYQLSRREEDQPSSCHGRRYGTGACTEEHDRCNGSERVRTGEIGSCP